MKHRHFQSVLALPLLLVCLFSRPSILFAADNLVQGLPASYDPKPNYTLCTDDNDPMQLTDGVLSSGRNDAIEGAGAVSIWGQKTTVGWMHTTPITITFDLGRVQPIGGISLRSAAGASGVYWPRAIAILVSDDARQWHYAGDLISLSRQHKLPPIQSYNVHWFTVENLKAKGRYISFLVSISGTAFFFTDEIEVYRGEESAPTPAGITFPDMESAKKFVADNATRFGMAQRMSRDYAAVAEELEATALPPAEKNRLRQKLEIASIQIDTLTTPDAREFKAILPFNDAHAAILAVHGALLQARGLPRFFAWKNHRNDYVEWLAIPPQPSTAAPAALDIALLGNQRRSDAFWLCNAGEQGDSATLSVVSPPRDAQPGWLRISAVPWTDTAQNAPVAVALPAAMPVQGSYEIPLAAGMNRKIWLTIDSSKLPPGHYHFRLDVRFAGTTSQIPVSVRILPVTMPRPELSLTMWDYTDRRGMYGLTAENMASSIVLMRDNFVDAPWGSPSLLPIPQPGDFDGENRLNKALDFKLLNEWVVRWPDARRYMVFINQHTEMFAGAKMGTPEFQARLGAWARALADQMHALGKRPEQLTLLIVDEPYTDAADAIVAGWIKGIKSGAPEIQIFNDPVWPDPTKAVHQEAITLADIVCPNTQIFNRGGEKATAYYEARRDAGQQLWFYQCSADSRLSDPTRYYRFQPWRAFRYGATGVGYWSFADMAGAVNSYNPYTSKSGTTYALGFLGNMDATQTLQLEAVRDGVQDYSEFVLLRQAAAKSANSQLKAAAEELLSPATIDVISGDPSADYTWQTAARHEFPDEFRLKVLELLEKL